MLKFEKTAVVGDVVKAFDFKPMEGRDDMYMTGLVLEKGPIFRHFGDDESRKVYWCDGYTVKVIGGDADSKERVGEIAYIPFEVDFMEHDERISVVATNAEFELLKAHLSKAVIH